MAANGENKLHTISRIVKREADGGRWNVVRPAGLEPATYGFEATNRKAEF